MQNIDPEKLEYINSVINEKKKYDSLQAKRNKLQNYKNFLEKATTQMKSEYGKLNKSKILMKDEENGIIVEKRVKQDRFSDNLDFSTFITIDLTKHSDPDEYAEKIEEICEFINENKNDYIQPIRRHKRNEDKYEIQCTIAYSYSFFSYHNQHDCLWYELKSFLYDLIEIKHLLENEYQQYPAYIIFESYSLVTKKNYSLPCPQSVLLPIPFILAYLKGITETNIDETLISACNFFIEKRKGILSEDVEEEMEDEKIGVQFLMEFKEFLEKEKPTYEEIIKDSVGEDIMFCRFIEPLDLEDQTELQVTKFLNCGAHGVVFSCKYQGKEYAIKQCIQSEIPTMKREAFVLHNCNNPFIISFIKFGENTFNLCAQAKTTVYRELEEKYSGKEREEKLEVVNNIIDAKCTFGKC